ncbi:MAG: hypothetical protein Tsb0032_36860 [Kiloniellaceae bacterium]
MKRPVSRRSKRRKRGCVLRRAETPSSAAKQRKGIMPKVKEARFSERAFFDFAGQGTAAIRGAFDGCYRGRLKPPALPK